MSPRSAHAPLNGIDCAYEMAGDGPPVVLLHAGIADSRMWAAQFDALATNHTVIAYDRRGFGRTRPAPGPFNHVDDLAALLGYLGIKRTALVGCSQGSRIALDFALAHPDQVSRIVLSAPSVSGFRYDGPPPRQADAIDAAEAAGDLARVNELEMQIWVDGPRRAPDAVASSVRRLVAEMNAIALANEGVGEERPPDRPAAGRLGEVGAPVLLVVGELDAAITLAVAEALAGGLPNVRRVDLLAAHLPNMEQPEAFNRAVGPFLGERA